LKRAPTPKTVPELRALYLDQAVVRELSYYKDTVRPIDAAAGIAALRTMDRPPRLSDSHHAYELIVRGFPLYNLKISQAEMRRILDECAEEYTQAIETDPLLSGVRLYDELSKLLRPEACRVYRGRRGDPIVVSASKDAPLMAFSKMANNRFQYDELSEAVLFDIVEGTWRYGATERRCAAREFVVQHVDDHVAGIRSRALQKWDPAVAVADDGSEVFEATDVLVINKGSAGEPAAVLYPASAFGERKMVVPSQKNIASQNAQCTRETFLGKERLTGFVANLLRKELMRGYVRFSNGTRMLVCDRHVAGDLPSGGETLL
jgi:hypothetical protein